MAFLLFKLKNVPEDEAEEVRSLLEASELDYYETSSGVLGLSYAAIWLKQESQIETAQALIDNYQSERVIKARQLITEQKLTGNYISGWDQFKQSPIRYSAVLVLISTLLFFTLAPFILL